MFAVMIACLPLVLTFDALVTPLPPLSLPLRLLRETKASKNCVSIHVHVHICLYAHGGQSAISSIPQLTCVFYLFVSERESI